MKSLEQIRENQKMLHDLAVAIDLWSKSTNATDDIKAKTGELYDRLQVRLQELELQAQNVKIDTMLKVLALYKGDKDV
jgi:hypothetical protein